MDPVNDGPQASSTLSDVVTARVVDSATNAEAGSVKEATPEQDAAEVSRAVSVQDTAPEQYEAEASGVVNVEDMTPEQHDAEASAAVSVQETAPEQDNAETNIEADSYSDSGYGGGSIYSLGSSNRSLEVNDILRHGHRYHGSENVLLPNDESEQDRLDLQHHILKMCLDGHVAMTQLPPTAQHIFDVGTGTGIWAIEMADKYPHASIVGVDVSPIQPLWVPPNVQFEIDDATKPWLRSAGSMDFVHIRNMVGSIRDWRALFAQALEHLKPGGRIEVTDIRTQFECLDGTFQERGKACKEWADTFHEIASGMGMDFDPTPLVPEWLSEVGFEDVQLQSRIIPVGPWPKDRKLKILGAYYLSHMLDGGMENYSMMLFTKAGWAEISVRALLGKVKSELKDLRMHTFTHACFVTGRKKLQ